VLWHGRIKTNSLFLYTFNGKVRLYSRAFTDDKWPVVEVILSNIYEHEKFYKFSSAPVIVDIGAHIGSFVIPQAQRWPAATIVAVEAMPQTCEILQLNLNINNCSNVKVVPRAVAAHVGEIVLGTSFCKTMANTRFSASTLVGGITHTIPAVTLSSLIIENDLQHIDWLKMDIEGSEFEVIRTVPNEMWQRIANISLEYHLLKPEDRAEQLIEIFKQAGFELLEHKKLSSVLGILKWRQQKEPQTTNAVLK